MRRLLPGLKLAVPLIFAVGCSADVETPPASAESGAAGSQGTGSGPGPQSSTCQTGELARTPLRRLTRFEYASTVRELLNVDVGAAAELPADEVTNGYDNNAAVLTVSSLHAEKYVLVSESLAKLAVQTNLSALTAGCDTATQGEDACALDFAKRFGRRAFRRPTTAEDERQLLAAYAAGRSGGSFAEGIEVMIRAALQSPSFLYRLETTPPADPNAKWVALSPFELATRLSYLVWGSGPDDALLDAAARGELATREQMATKAREMLAQPKARAAVNGFFEQWTSARRLAITTKNTAVFPAFSSELRDAMAKELPAFVSDVLWSGDRKLSTLLTAPVAYVSGPLAELYGVSPTLTPADGSPVKVALPPEQGRAGLLTQAGFLSVQGHPDQTSPVLRGKFVRTMLLCQPPPPPPNDANISLPQVEEGATARERFGAHESAAASCAGCHRLMDPIGLTFEHFDGMGRYREREGDRELDVSGEIVNGTDASLSGTFNGTAELGAKLANSEQVRDCVAKQFFRFAAGRTEADGDTCSLAAMQEAFGASGGDVVELIVATTQTDTFWYRPQVK